MKRPFCPTNLVYPAVGIPCLLQGVEMPFGPVAFLFIWAGIFTVGESFWDTNEAKKPYWFLLVLKFSASAGSMLWMIGDNSGENWAFVFVFCFLWLIFTTSLIQTVGKVYSKKGKGVAS